MTSSFSVFSHAVTPRGAQRRQLNVAHCAWPLCSGQFGIVIFDHGDVWFAELNIVHAIARRHPSRQPLSGSARMLDLLRVFRFATAWHAASSVHLNDGALTPARTVFASRAARYTSLRPATRFCIHCSRQPEGMLVNRVTSIGDGGSDHHDGWWSSVPGCANGSQRQDDDSQRRTYMKCVYHGRLTIALFACSRCTCGVCNRCAAVSRRTVCVASSRLPPDFRLTHAHYRFSEMRLVQLHAIAAD